MGALFVLSAAVGLGIYAFNADTGKSGEGFLETNPSGLTKSSLAASLSGNKAYQGFPGEMELPIDGSPQRVVLQYTFDPKLQEDMEQAFRTYRPDYGAFVAIDAETGRVLAMVSHSEHAAMPDNMALRATFPAASIFKVVTAAAAIAEKNFSADTTIPFSGRNHTLYKNQIVKTVGGRWARQMTLKEAFSKSVNTVFGRIGVFTVGEERLKTYASRFGFNRKIDSDMTIQEGRADFTSDPWSLAEAASGYTRDNTMSPMQGALIGAAIANDGKMMEPYVVESVHSLDGSSLYASKSKVGSIAVDPATAFEIRRLGAETVIRGTSRKSFRGFFSGRYAQLKVGGKTGSLTGMDPPGKYDWFVGWAHDGNRKIGIAALTVHGKLWRVKSSALARRAIEKYFRDRGAMEALVPTTQKYAKVHRR
jgi:cell division protein FtsI/penicillin-binding protein 2